MEGELGSGARIAIALIVVGVIIGIVFVILGFTRGATTQGVGTVQNAMDQMQTSTFDDYDQHVVSGTQVLSAIKLFEGRPIGIVVITALSSDSHYGINYGAQFVDSSTATTSLHQIAFTANSVTKSDSTKPSDDDLLSKISGNSFYTEDLRTETDGTMKFNMSTVDAKKSGIPAFIRPTAKFLGELIKDSSGTITGVCFTQQ